MWFRMLHLMQAVWLKQILHRSRTYIRLQVLLRGYLRYISTRKGRMYVSIFQMSFTITIFYNKIFFHLNPYAIKTLPAVNIFIKFAQYVHFDDLNAFKLLYCCSFIRFLQIFCFLSILMLEVYFQTRVPIDATFDGAKSYQYSLR